MIVRERKLERRVSATCGPTFVKQMDEIAFDSLSELLSHRYRERPEGGFRWIGCHSVADLKDKVDNGWVEMESRMSKMLEEIMPPPAELKPEINRRRRRFRSDFGNSVDIHQIWQGRTDRAWDATRVEEIETIGNKLVHICINMSASAGVAFDSGLWRGAAAMRIFDVLTRMGKSVAISGFYASVGAFRGSRRSGMASCRLKEYGEPLRTDRLAAMVTLGFMRTYLMMLGLDQHPTLAADSGRGYPIDDYKLLTYASEEDQTHGGSVVSIGQCFTRDQAQDVVDKFIRQYVRGEEVESLSAFEQMKTWRSSDAPHTE